MRYGFTVEKVRETVARRLDFLPDDHDGDFHLNPDMREDIMGGVQKHAAVLIGIVERAGDAQVILTKRTEKLSSHSGQVAFPGGKIDDDDASPEHAALREAWEEIGLDINEVDVMGRLPDYHSGSGFLIAPVIGIVSPHADFRINRDEVEYRFEVPLSFLMDPANHHRSSRSFGGR
ncbi:MAG: CoA pyrophosphatase, partial [Pseudomonadota bacterium]